MGSLGHLRVGARMSKGQHHRQAMDRVATGNPPWRVGAALIAVITLVTSVMITTSASASEDPAPDAAFTVTATSDPAFTGSVAPGADVTYTLKVANTATDSAETSVTVVDDLSKVLAASTITTSPGDLAAAGLALDKDKGTLTWTPAEPIAGGGSSTATFSVTVNDSAADGEALSTTATVQGSDATCTTGDACSTTLTVTAPAESTDATVDETPATDAGETADSSSAPTTSSAPATTKAEPSTSAPATTSAEPSTTTSDSSSSSSADSSSSTKATAPSSSSAAASSSTKAGRAGTQAAAIGGGVSPNAVPAPGATTSIVTVKVGGDRTGVTGVTPLPGVTLGLYAAQTGGTA